MAYVDATPDEEAMFNGAAPAQAPALTSQYRDATPEEEAAFSGTPAAPKEAPGLGESILRGGAQGLSLGFSDEIAGLGKALFQPSTGGATFSERYRKARDEERAANAAAQSEHPWGYGGGELAGGVASSFIPGLGVAEGAQGALAVAKSAAKVGAIAGLGGSDREDLSGQLRDAASGALTSAGTAGLLSRVMEAAPKRSVQRVIGDISDGAPARLRDKLVGRVNTEGEGRNIADIVREVDQHPVFAAAKDDAIKQAAVGQKILDKTGEEIADVYGQIDKNALGVPLKEIRQALSSVKADLAGNPANKASRRAVDRMIADVTEEWGDDRFVPLKKVREFVTSTQNEGFAGPLIDPSARRQLQRETASAVKGVLDRRFDEIASTAKAISSKPTIAAHEPFGDLANLEEAATKIGDLNKKYATWKNIMGNVERRAQREASPSTRLKDRVGQGLDLGLAFTSPSTFIAKKAYDVVGKQALRAGDDRLAQLVLAAQHGNTGAQIAQRAIQLGFAPVVARSLSSWVQRTAAETDSAEAQ